MSSRSSEHEYEPIAAPPPPPPPPVVSMVAPVVRITDTDVTPVADSDDSIDDRGRFNLRLALDGDIILPLDGKIEDNAMAGRELGETIDTSDEMESEQLQERLEGNFSRMSDSNLDQNVAEGGSVPSQVPVEEEIPNKQANLGLQEKLRNQAEKLTSRLKNFQRPSFTVPNRCKLSKKKPAPVSIPENQKTKKLNRMERFKMSLPERPRFQFPSMSKLSLKKHPKLNIKRPKVHLPAAISSTLKRAPSSRVKQKQQSTKSSYGSHKNIFSHFSSCQKIFDWKTKNKDEYTTSSPKETRAHVIDSFTYPRAKTTFKDRGNQEFKENEFLDEDMSEQRVAIERTRPWRHASLEEPRLAFRIQSSESHEESENLPWEIEQKTFIYQDEIQYADYDEGSQDHPCQADEDIEADKDNYNGDEHKLRIIRLKRIEDFRNNDNNNFEESTPSLDFNQIEIRSMSYEENSPGPSNAEQRSSGSSCGKPRHVIQEIDSDNFSIHDDNSHDDINVKMYIDRNLHKFHEDTYTNSLTDFNVSPVPPQRPYRTKSIRKRKEKFSKSVKDSPPMHTRNDQILHYSDLSLEHLTRRDSFSNSTHRIVYRAETISREQSPIDYLDDIVVLKPTRGKSKSSIHSQAESHIESNKNFDDGTAIESFSPIVPCRRKRSRNQNINGVIDTENAINNSICNGHNVLENSLHDELSSNKHFMYYPLDTEREKNLLQNVEVEMFQVPPIPPKRRSRSRTASFTTDKNHSLHDVESISEVYLADCDMAQVDLHEQSPGYAVIEKREKSSHVPPPRQRRHKSATNPRSSTPKRTHRAYSTLSHVKNNIPKVENTIDSSEDVTQYVNIDSDEEHKNFKSEFLNKVQSRPLPAPPRPPRLQKLSKTSEYNEPEIVRDSGEAVASTQTDPLPDDEVIEEEITQAKLVMSHSRHGSQILISTERIPTPTLLTTMPSSQISHQPLENDDLDHLVKPMSKSEEIIPDKNDILRTALLSEEPIRINNLEVGDLRVDRLSVSQLEAFKIAASEIDAMVVSASELRREGSHRESEINQSLLEELLAIRNRLETVAQFQERPRSTTEDACTATNDEESNIPGDFHVADDVLPSPLQHVETEAETRSGNVEIIKMKVNNTVEPMARPSTQTEILQEQILQVKNLKPESEIRPEMDLATSRETSVEKDASLQQKVRSSSISPMPPSGKDFKIPSHAKSLTPVTDTSKIRPTHRTTLEMLSQQTITPHIEGRECTIETSQIPAHFFSLASPISPQAETEISLSETTRQMFRAIRIIGVRNLRHIVNYIASKVGREDASDKIREVELVLCALLLIVAGLLIISFGSPRNVTHHHHWDYFNPPQ